MTDQIADMRARARRIFDSAVRAADPVPALRQHLKTAPRPRGGGRQIVISVGKAAPAMMAEAMAHFGSGCTALAITHRGNEADSGGAPLRHAGHPLPDQAGHDAAREVIALLDEAGPQDQVIALISGGGSALMPAPAGTLTLEDKIAVNKLLLASGLGIEEMNLIRQQLSELKGGGFLRHAEPAPVTAYILSDVIGDDLRAIASGPTVAPIGSRAEAARLARSAGFWDRLPQPVRAHLEKTCPPPTTPTATNILIGSNRLSLEAMATTAGRSARIVNDHLVGDVADAAELVVETLRQEATRGPAALIFGGETTVRLSGTGLGGRNQEMALRVAMAAERLLPGRWVFLSGGTDGRDGPTDAAGGLVDSDTVTRLRMAGADPAALLANNDSNRALDLSGDLLVTGATGTNVADVQLLLIE
ncbi:hydroxypyruvate reductase [Brevirhabdus pacifica]|nr:DUF4147 domain-containing protein [Brevirhabdus pacifica]PJJ82998.1 hydroxypyruvate reductase [Brevirhabdus pacifica]